MAEQEEQYDNGGENGENMEEQTEVEEVEDVGEGEGEGEGDGGAASGDKINSSKNDDDERKIFVGGLSWETTVKDLQEYFEKFGEVVDCTLKTDPNTQRSRGFGFVQFADVSAVEKVIAQEVHTLHNRNIDPKRAKARAGREPIKKVFVGGLDPELSQDQIRDYFSQYGKVVEIDLPFDKIKNERRRFCFITFESEEIVDKVVAIPKQELVPGDATKVVDVKKATPKHDQFGGPRGGFRGGFRGGRGGRGRGGYSPGGWNQGYDYNSYYNQGYGGYGNYDYNNYYNNDYYNYYNQGGWGNQPYGGYGNYSGYDYSGWYDDQSGGNQQGSYKQQGRGGNRGSGYHPYQR